MVRELKYKLEDMLKTMPEDKSKKVPASAVQIFYQAENIFQQTSMGDNTIQQAASGENLVQNADLQVKPELKALLDKLRQTVEEFAPPEERQEKLEIVDEVEKIVTSEKPKVSILKALLDSLSPIASVSSITASILKILGN